MPGGQPAETEKFFPKKTNAFLNARPLDKSIVLWYNISIKRGGKDFETPLETTAEVDDLKEKKTMWITGRIIQKKGSLLLVRQHWSGYLYEVEMKDCRFKKDDHREVKFSHSDATAVRW